MLYHCAICGEEHDELPFLDVDRPRQWEMLSERERENSELMPDVCVVRSDDEEESFFVRGVLEIPILDSTDKFGLGLWISQKKENFQTYMANFESDQIGPFFGWLSNQVSYYDEATMPLKTMVHFRGNKLRPIIELEPTEHPLAVAQREGITLDEAWKIVHFYADGS